MIQIVANTAAAFQKHASAEECVLFDILHPYKPALVAILRDNRCNCMCYLNDLSALIGIMQTANDKQKSKLFSHPLVYRLDEFIAATLQQLRAHEQMINAVLWKYYSDKKLVNISALFMLKPSAFSHKKEMNFADNILINRIPAAGITRSNRHGRINASCKQNCAKTFALAV